MKPLEILNGTEYVERVKLLGSNAQYISLLFYKRKWIFFKEKYEYTALKDPFNGEIIIPYYTAIKIIEIHT